MGQNKVYFLGLCLILAQVALAGADQPAKTNPEIAKYEQNRFVKFLAKENKKLTDGYHFDVAGDFLTAQLKEQENKLLEVKVELDGDIAVNGVLSDSKIYKTQSERFQLMEKIIKKSAPGVGKKSAMIFALLEVAANAEEPVADVYQVKAVQNLAVDWEAEESGVIFAAQSLVGTDDSRDHKNLTRLLKIPNLYSLSLNCHPDPSLGPDETYMAGNDQTKSAGKVVARTIQMEYATVDTKTKAITKKELFIRPASLQGGETIGLGAGDYRVNDGEVDRGITADELAAVDCCKPTFNGDPSCVTKFNTQLQKKYRGAEEIPIKAKDGAQ